MIDLDTVAFVQKQGGKDLVFVFKNVESTTYPYYHAKFPSADRRDAALKLIADMLSAKEI